MKTFTPPSPVRQRGAAALVVTLLLFFAALLVVVFTHRNLITEARSSANQLRAAQAFEAAQAGVDWALARLNDPAPIDASCRPAAGADSFRDRHLRYVPALATLVPVTWDDAGTPTPLRAACLRTEAGWTCGCPAAGPAVLPDSAGATEHAFTVELRAGARAGLFGIVATGCTRMATGCGATTDAGHEAAARIETAVALLPGLRLAPAAPLTVGGNVDAGAAALGAHNPDPASGGVAVHAGGSVAGAALRLGVPAGLPLDSAVVANDAWLGSVSAERSFARHFGMARAAWAAQPAATRVACAGSCTAALAAALAGGSTLIAIDGDLTLEGPIALGSAARPVIVAVAGTVRWNGAVEMHGLLHGSGFEWRGPGGGAARLSGAAVVAGDYGGDGDPDFVYDTDTLARLRAATGSIVRVNGSWKDF